MVIHKNVLILYFALLIGYNGKSDIEKSIPRKFEGYELRNQVKRITKRDIKPKVIDISSEPGSQLKLNEVIDSIWHVKLESKDQKLIGEITDIIYFDQKYIIFDRKSKSIFVFNSKGKFIERIKNIGKGPGEYSYPLCVGLDKNNNYFMLYDDKQSKVLYYDLTTYEFVKEIRVYFRFLEFHVLDDGKIIVHTHRRHNAHLPKIHNYEIVVVDSAWNILQKGQIFNKRQRKFVFSARKSFKVFNSKLYYHPPFNDTIFYYSNGSLIAEYYLDYKNRSLPIDFDYDITPTEFANKHIVNKSNIMFFIGEYNISNSHYNGKNLYCLYDFNKNRLFSGSEIVKNKFNSAFFSFPFSNSNDTLIDFIPSYLVELAKDDLSKRKDLKKMISDKLNDLIINTNKNDNPILVLYTLK